MGRHFCDWVTRDCDFSLASRLSLSPSQLIYFVKATYHAQDVIWQGTENGLQPTASKELRLSVSAKAESHQQLCMLEVDRSSGESVVPLTSGRRAPSSPPSSVGWASVGGENAGMSHWPNTCV